MTLSKSCIPFAPSTLAASIISDDTLWSAASTFTSTMGYPFHIHTTTTIAKAHCVLPSHEICFSISPCSRRKLLNSPYMGFASHLNISAITTSGKSHGRTRIVLKMVMPRFFWLRASPNKIPIRKCPATTRNANLKVIHILFKNLSCVKIAR